MHTYNKARSVVGKHKYPCLITLHEGLHTAKQVSLLLGYTEEPQLARGKATSGTEASWVQGQGADSFSSHCRRAAYRRIP